MKQIVCLLLTAVLVSVLMLPVSAAPIDVNTPANVVRAEPKAVSGVDVIVTDLAWNNDADNDAQVKPGTSLTFRITLKNQGNKTSDAITVEVTASARAILTLQAEPLKAGATATVTADKTWTPTAGDYRITAAVSCGEEANTDNNDYAENLRVANNVLKAPAAALKRGYNKLTFCDDFNSLSTIDTTASGAEGYHWYVTRPWGEPDQRLNVDYHVANGALTVKTANKSAWAWSLCTIDARKTSGFAFNHGYLEYSVRLPYTSDDEVKLKNGVRNPGVWAHPADSVWASVTGVHNVRNVEVDWLEYKGTKYKGGAQFHICLHDTLDLVSDDGGKQDHHATVGGKFFHNDGYAVGGDGKFHVFGCAWSEGILEYYLDGRLIHVKTYSENGYPDPMPTGPGSEKMGIFYPLEEQYMPVVLGAVDEFRMEVDYVRIWQSDGTVKPQPTYSRMATEFVGIYMTDAKGNLVKQVNKDTVPLIYAAEEYWNMLLGDERDEVTRMLGVSYSELLAKAKQGVQNGDYQQPTTTVAGMTTTTTAPTANGDQNEGEAPSFPTVWIVVLIGGLVVLLGMVATIVVLSVRGRKAAASSDTNVEDKIE